jgi:hypothetical protein
MLWIIWDQENILFCLLFYRVYNAIIIKKGNSHEKV